VVTTKEQVLTIEAGESVKHPAILTVLKRLAVKFHTYHQAHKSTSCEHLFLALYSHAMMLNVKQDAKGAKVLAMALEYTFETSLEATDYLGVRVIGPPWEHIPVMFRIDNLNHLETAL
jgi:hypothetical protein